MFRTKDTKAGQPAAYSTSAPPDRANRPATLIERLEFQQKTKEAQFAALYAELTELDETIARLKRLKSIDPRVEQLVQSFVELTVVKA